MTIIDQYYQLLIGTSIRNLYLDNCFEINENSTLKTLITTAKLILKLKTPPSQSSPSLDLKVKEKVEQEKKEEEEGKKEKVFPKFIKNIKAVETIEEIDNFIKKIDKVNLKSFLDIPINFSNSDNNEIKNFIKKLLKLYFSNSDTKVSKILYFCYYHEESNYDYKTIFPSTLHLIETALRFGIYEILEPKKTMGCHNFLPKIGQDSNYQYYNSHRYKFLFSHCYDKEKMIKFIDRIIQRTIQQPEPGFQIYFLYMLVIHNDIELVKYYSNNVGKHLQIYSPREIFPPTYYIESKEMLEYLFYNQCNYFIDVYFKSYKSSYFKNLELLKHFELLFVVGNFP